MSSLSTLDLYEVELNNVVLFEKARLPIVDNCGLVIITGINLDSSEKDQSNAIGKSLSLSVLGNVFYQAAPTSLKKNSKKDMLAKDTSISVSFRNSKGIESRVEQTAKGYKIFDADGKELVDQKVRTDRIQREAVAERFPITSTEFYSYIYIQTQRDLVFQKGTPTDRLNFIIDAFNLDMYDRMRKYFLERLQEVKTSQTEVQVLQEKLDKTVLQIQQIEWQGTESAVKLQKLEKKHKTYETRLFELDEQRQQLGLVLNTVKSIASVDEKLDALRYDYPFSEQPSKVLEKLKKDAETTRVKERYDRELASYKKHTTSLKEELAQLGDIPKDTDRVLKQINGYEERLIKQQDKAKGYANDYKSMVEAKEDMDGYKAALSDLGVPSSRIRKADIEQLEAKQYKYLSIMEMRTLLEHDHKEGNCPTCQQPIDVEAISLMVKEAETKYGQCKKLIKAKKLYTKYLEARSRYEDFDPKLDVLAKQSKEACRALIKRIDTLRLKLRDAEIAHRIKKRLASFEPPEKPNTSLYYEYSLEEIKKYASDCRKILGLIEAKEGLLEESQELADLCSTPESIEAALFSYQKKINAVLVKKKKGLASVQALSSDIRSLQYARERYIVLEQQTIELKAELESRKPLIEKRELYEHLVKAYSKQGLKLHAAGQVVSTLEQKMNEYAPLIYSEDITFQIRTVPQGLSCMAKRSNGQPPCDVSLLSGSETNCFRLLFMISMLSIVSPSRRTNFVVLDEADSAMSEPSRRKYIEDFIPTLRTVVPHVFVITPADPNRYPDSEHWTVIKERGKSKILRNGTELV